MIFYSASQGFLCSAPFIILVEIIALLLWNDAFLTEFQTPLGISFIAAYLWLHTSRRYTTNLIRTGYTRWGIFPLVPTPPLSNRLPLALLCAFLFAFLTGILFPLIARGSFIQKVIVATGGAFIVTAFIFYNVMLAVWIFSRLRYPNL